MKRPADSACQRSEHADSGSASECVQAAKNQQQQTKDTERNAPDREDDDKEDDDEGQQQDRRDRQPPHSGDHNSLPDQESGARLERRSYFGALMNSNPLARPLSTVKTILDVSDEAK